MVQGVGFRPFVYRLAQTHHLAGWVRNGEQGVEIFLEGAEPSVERFVEELETEAPPAASISQVEVDPAKPEGFLDFAIRESERIDRPTVRVSPDLPVCDECLRELFDPADRRYLYPYINCTNCGPRYTVVLGLPYDRPKTTMKDWPLDAYCRGEYGDPANRRFHAQPVACAECGPTYFLQIGDERIFGAAAIERTAEILRDGKILAVKGLGGYHLACDARNGNAVRALRERKYRKEKPFAVMARDVEIAAQIVELSNETRELLTGIARPIVLARAKQQFPGVAPENHELGVMLPYTPLHHLLFASGAPEVLVMTSANRSSEPIAYEDADAIESLVGIADAFLIGDRPIARRVDDSVARVGAYGPAILRRARGYAPGAVATIPCERPILALGADLKNALTLVVDGQAFVSQHIGDLEHYTAFQAFEETIRDLLAMYEVKMDEVLLVHDAHPQYRTTLHAAQIAAKKKVAVQHHRAHIASVLAERGEWNRCVVGVSFDGTGWGDDGTVWGGEIFAGSVHEGFERVAHLRPAVLPGGDAAAEFPVQAAAGFLAQLGDLPDLCAAPFNFPERFRAARELVTKNVRCFGTTSMGRLFDTAAALIGFTRETTYEGQAAIWVEQLARRTAHRDGFEFPYTDGELDFRPLLTAVIQSRLTGVALETIARRFQVGVAHGISECLRTICKEQGAKTVVLSGGVFQNELLLGDLKPQLDVLGLEVWTNRMVPTNDGGISLGQAAMAAFARTN
ncbi:(NiFe) hydrogenase maturation protein HypF [Candidatus Koribacter versatilis Ellin345]|uniref:Carbamoyltransferase n=1 Tax=Koribacter versatilis (strain Ellin345) TaxID=204669 RepID=Q1IT71_KORVE|nr:(NiFe) hydrogenase maturation protein HypF [Candidatus Koribacter versatilis Ellin345]